MVSAGEPGTAAPAINIGVVYHGPVTGAPVSQTFGGAASSDSSMIFSNDIPITSFRLLTFVPMDLRRSCLMTKRVLFTTSMTLTQLKKANSETTCRRSPPLHRLRLPKRSPR